MAIAQLSVRVGSKGKAKAHASYILREDKYKPHAEKSEILESKNHGNMPAWAENNPKLFWEMSDREERKNGSTYREHIIALPRELDENQRLELVQDWIKSEIGDKHPYSYAIHTPKAMDGKEQPHCHLMFSERTLDGIDRGADQFFKRYNSKNPEKGGAKKANKSATYTERKTELKEMRSRWGDMANKHLERAGRYERIDMRNWKDRGVSEQDKPKNLSKEQLADPTIKQAHVEKLTAQAELKQAQRDLISELNGTALTELNKQKRIARDKAEQAPKVTPAKEVKPQEKPQEVAPKPQGVTLQELQGYKAQQSHKIVYENVVKYSPAKLDKSIEDFEHKARELEQRAEQQGVISEKDFKDYQFYKTVIFTSEQIKLERERQAPIQEKPQSPPQGANAGATAPPPKTTADNDRPKPAPAPPPQAEQKHIDPVFKQIKDMDKEQRKALKDKALQVTGYYQSLVSKSMKEHGQDRQSVKNQIAQQLPNVHNSNHQAEKWLDTLQRVEQNERLEQRAEQMKQDRELGNDRGK